LLALTFGSSLYKLMVLLHVFSAVVAFAPGWVWPVLNVRMRKGEGVPGPVRALVPVLSATVYGPALILNGVFGALAVVFSAGDGTYVEFSHPWVSIAFVLWFLMLGILFLGLIPAERKEAQQGATVEAESRVAMFGGMLHLLFLLQLINMIWQPGQGG
jgi:hypothetical protein